MPGKPLHCKAFRASFTLVAAGYIAAGNSVLRRQLTLGPGRLSVQTVALADDVRLPLRQALVHQLADTDVTLTGVQIIQHGVLYTHNVHEEQIVAILVRLQGLRQGHLALELFLTSEEHEDLIFNTPGRIGGKTDILLRLIAGNPFDEANGADGYEIILVYIGGVVFLKRIPREEDFSRWKATSHRLPNFR